MKTRTIAPGRGPPPITNVPDNSSLYPSAEQAQRITPGIINTHPIPIVLSNPLLMTVPFWSTSSLKAEHTTAMPTTRSNKTIAIGIMAFSINTAKIKRTRRKISMTSSFLLRYTVWKLCNIIGPQFKKKVTINHRHRQLARKAHQTLPPKLPEDSEYPHYNLL